MAESRYQPSPGFGSASQPSPGFGSASQPSPGSGSASQPSPGSGSASLVSYEVENGLFGEADLGGGGGEDAAIVQNGAAGNAEAFSSFAYAVAPGNQEPPVLGAMARQAAPRGGQGAWVFSRT